MKKTDVLENEEKSANYTMIEQLKNLLNQKPTRRKEMAILLDKRANAIVELVKAREQDARELQQEKSRVQAANLYIILLALQVEKLHCAESGEDITNFFTLNIPKTELAEVLKNNTIQWSESEDKQEILLQIGLKIPEEEAIENAVEVDDTREGNTEGNNDSSPSQGSEVQ